MDRPLPHGRSRRLERRYLEQCRALLQRRVRDDDVIPLPRAIDERVQRVVDDISVAKAEERRVFRRVGASALLRCNRPRVQQPLLPRVPDRLALYGMLRERVTKSPRALGTSIPSTERRHIGPSKLVSTCVAVRVHVLLVRVRVIRAATALSTLSSSFRPGPQAWRQRRRMVSTPRCSPVAGQGRAPTTELRALCNGDALPPRE